MDCTLLVYIKNASDLCVLVLNPLPLLTMFIGFNSEPRLTMSFQLLYMFLALWCLYVCFFRFSIYNIMLTMDWKSFPTSLPTRWLFFFFIQFSLVSLSNAKLNRSRQSRWLCPIPDLGRGKFSSLTVMFSSFFFHPWLWY